MKRIQTSKNNNKKDFMMMRLIKPALLTTSFLFTPMLVAEPLTQNQLHATMGIVTNYILDDNSIRFHGKSYKSITSPHTGRVWLDRNIGANKKCDSSDDAQCYGNYFQWGRKHDGHESSVDSTTVQATNINDAGAEFIRGSLDWASTDLNYGIARATNWLKTDGSSVCPVGYRVPLGVEIQAELGNINNAATAYTNFLKLPAAGARNYLTTNYFGVGTSGRVWSVSSTETGASYYHFYSASFWMTNGDRAWGLSVRCIKHKEEYVRDDAKQVVTQIGAGLMWQDNAAVATVRKPWITIANHVAGDFYNISGDTATIYCAALNRGGFTDWRLPSREELSGIVKSSVTQPSISAVFKHTMSRAYWSSTTYASNITRAWSVSFSYGLHSYFLKYSVRRVRCVREGQ